MKLPELKKRFKNKYVIRIAAGVLTVAVAGGSLGVYTVQAEKDSKAKTETTQEAKDEDEELEEVLSSKVSNSENEVGKEETVYVVADNTGKTDTVIVSDWLKNPEGADTIEDASDLKDIKNVKGKEKYEEKDGKLVWKAKGKDIYYQGKTDKEIPVKQTITYYLDGEKMDPEDIAGKSGKVTIRFDYKNNQKTTVTVDGKEHSVYVPFTVLTGMVLDDSYSNVEVKNGKVISDGDKQMVAGVAMPGLKSSLQVKSSDFAGDVEIPEYVEVTADVKDFKLDMTMSVMMSGIATGDDIEDMVDLGDLDDAIDTLSDSSKQLADGSGELAKGLDTLNGNMAEFKAGVQTLKNGIDTLNGSSGTLISGAESINSAAKSISDGIASLDATLNTPMSEEEIAAAKAEAAQTAVAAVDAQLADPSNPQGTAQTAQYAADVFYQSMTGDENVARVQAGLEQNLGDSIKITLREQIVAALGEDSGLQGLCSANSIDYPANVSRDNAVAALYNNSAQIRQGVAQALNTQVPATYAELQTAVVKSQTKELAAALLQQIAAGAKEQVGASVAEAAKTGAESGAAGAAGEAAVQGAEKAKKTVAAGIEAKQANGHSLVSGSAALSQGTQELVKSMPTLSVGVSALADGAGKINTATGQIADGVGQLESGSNTLNEGMIKFDQEGIQKLADTYNGDVKGLMEKVAAVMKAGSDYQTFSDKNEDTVGEVKFIIRTEGVEAKED